MNGSHINTAGYPSIDLWRVNLQARNFTEKARGNLRNLVVPAFALGFLHIWRDRLTRSVRMLVGFSDCMIPSLTL